jgi:hypothetical protein
MINIWIGHIAWGLGTVLGAELVRDFYHVLSHIWSPLYRWHVWHHRVFRPDYTVVSDQIYRQGNWYHDVPEAIAMLTFSLIFAIIAHYFAPEHLGFAIIGCVYSLSFLFPAIARGMGIPKVDQLTDITLNEKLNLTDINNIMIKIIQFDSLIDLKFFLQHSHLL